MNKDKVAEEIAKLDTKIKELEQLKLDIVRQYRLAKLQGLCTFSNEDVHTLMCAVLHPYRVSDITYDRSNMVLAFKVQEVSLGFTKNDMGETVIDKAESNWTMKINPLTALIDISNDSFKLSETEIQIMRKWLNTRLGI